LAADGSSQNIDWLRGQTVAAACGIGNPEAFRRTLRQAGAAVQRFEVFRDHHAYTAADLDRLLADARAAGAKALVTTGKDFVKWRPLLGPAASPEPLALEMALEIVEGEDVLRQRLGALSASV
jgi:tetraacyldisaccharide 4'-kinase